MALNASHCCPCLQPSFILYPQEPSIPLRLSPGASGSGLYRPKLPISSCSPTPLTPDLGGSQSRLPQAFQLAKMVCVEGAPLPSSAQGFRDPALFEFSPGFSLALSASLPIATPCSPMVCLLVPPWAISELRAQRNPALHILASVYGRGHSTKPISDSFSPPAPDGPPIGLLS